MPQQKGKFSLSDLSQETAPSGSGTFSASDIATPQYPPTSMTDASGQLQMVPHEQLAQRMQQGWKVGPPTQQGDISSQLPEVKQANQDYSQRGAFGKAMSWTLGTLGPDAERYANKSGLAEDIQNAANNSSEQQSREASRIAATRPDGIMTRAAVGAKVLDSAVMGTVGSSMKVARAMATPVNAAAATAATLVPPLRLPIGAYYAIHGAMDAFTPQQPGESAPDAMERRLLGGASMAGGAAGAVSGFRPAVAATAAGVRGITSKVANTKLGQSAGIVAKPLAPVINDIPIVRGIAKGLKAVGDVPDQLNEVWNPGIKSQLLGPSETSTSPYGSFEPAPIGMADNLPPEAPPPTRVPLWRGIASGKPPVLNPKPLPPATPRAAALAQSGPPQPSPTLATAQPQFISPDEVLSHITGEDTGFELPRVVKQAPTDLPPEEIISTSKRGPIRPAADILREKQAGGWTSQQDIRQAHRADFMDDKAMQDAMRNDLSNEDWRSFMQRARETDAMVPGSRRAFTNVSRYGSEIPDVPPRGVTQPASAQTGPEISLWDAAAARKAQRLSDLSNPSAKPIISYPERTPLMRAQPNDAPSPNIPNVNEVEQAMAKSGTTATGDNQYFQQAKNMLGPKATISEISQQAQKLKLQAQDMEGQLRRSIQQAQARRAAQ